MKTFVRAFLPLSVLAALGLVAAGCAEQDRRFGMYDERYDQMAWGQGVDPPGDDDDNPPRDPYDHGYDRAGYRQERVTVTQPQPMRERVTHRADYNAPPMQHQPVMYQQVGEIRDVGTSDPMMDPDLDLRSPYSGDRYSEMGRYGNQPRENE